MRLEVKRFYSHGLDRPQLPEDPKCCAVLVQLDIGEADSSAADIFTIRVVTPGFLQRFPETRWGCGYLLVPEFKWHELDSMISRLVSSVVADTWPDAVAKLSRYMDWEFEGYDEYEG